MNELNEVCCNCDGKVLQFLREQNYSSLLEVCENNTQNNLMVMKAIQIVEELINRDLKKTLV